MKYYILRLEGANQMEDKRAKEAKERDEGGKGTLCGRKGARRKKRGGAARKDRLL
jgi:hypothetical protein